MADVQTKSPLIAKAIEHMRKAAALLEEFSDSEFSDDALFELYCRSTADRLKKRANKILPPTARDAKVIQMRSAK